MESWLFQYSLGEQQFLGLLRFNLSQMIRQQYQYCGQRASSDHHLERMIVTREDGEAVWAEPRLDQAAWAVVRPVRSAFQFHGSRRSS
jgi:hypothetical protein